MAACGRAAGARYWKHTRFAHARPFFKQINVEDVEGILMILMSPTCWLPCDVFAWKEHRAERHVRNLWSTNIGLGRRLAWGAGRRELQFFRSFETLSFKYFCSTCCRDSIISLLWDRWRLLVLSIQKSAISDLLWFRKPCVWSGVVWCERWRSWRQPSTWF